MKREKFRKLSVITLVIYMLLFLINFVYFNVIILRDSLEIMSVIEALVMFVINGIIPSYYFVNCGNKSSNKKVLNNMLLGSVLVSLLISVTDFNLSISFGLRLFQNISYLVFLYLIFYKNLVQKVLSCVVVGSLFVRFILNTVQCLSNMSSITNMLFTILISGILFVSIVFQVMYFRNKEK